MLHVNPAFSRIGEENAFGSSPRRRVAAAGGDIITRHRPADFKTPPHIVEAAIKALRDGEHGYTPTGITPLPRP